MKYKELQAVQELWPWVTMEEIQRKLEELIPIASHERWFDMFPSEKSIEILERYNIFPTKNIKLPIINKAGAEIRSFKHPSFDTPNFLNDRVSRIMDRRYESFGPVRRVDIKGQQDVAPDTVTRVASNSAES